jgi:hypothetical protein
VLKSIGEWVFKLLLLGIAASWLFIYWQKRDDERYMYHQQQSTADAEQVVAVIDTRTGTLYVLREGGWLEMHPQTASVTSRKMKFTGSN